MASQALATSEIQRLRSVMRTAHEKHGLIHCRTRKEATIIALDTDPSHPLDSFSMTLLPGETAATIEDAMPDMELPGWYLVDLPFEDPCTAMPVTDNAPATVICWR